jgi:thermitase
MEHRLRIGRRERTVEVLEDVVAFRPGGSATRAASLRGAQVGLRAPPVHPADPAMALRREEATALHAAGWAFTPRIEPLVTAARSGQAVQGLVAREVVRTEKGRVLLVGEILTIGFAPDTRHDDAYRAMQADGLSPLRRLPVGDAVFEVRTVGTRSAMDAAVELQENGRYAFVEPVFGEVIAGRMRPADPDYAKQWHHRNDGTSGGKAGADAALEDAWKITRGKRKDDDRPVRIGIVDNGIDVGHEDLRDAVHHGGHYKDDGAGTATFVPHPSATDPFPTNDHGTMCAGMAVARSNAVGGVGGAFEADFIPVACAADQVLTQATLARALVYAAVPSTEEAQRPDAEGADVISCSLGPNGPDWTLSSVLELAIERVVRDGRGGAGTLLFWAVSNGYDPISLDEVCSQASVIAVGRSTRLDVADATAYGPKLEFLAPGVEVYNTTLGGGYDFRTGTSFAAPLAAAIGALAIAVAPAGTSWTVIRDKLRSSCDKIGPLPYDPSGRNDQYGYGRLNAGRAVT